MKVFSKPDGRMASTAAGKQRIPKVAKVIKVLLQERPVS